MFSRKTITSPAYRLVFVISYIAAITFIDIYCYGIIYQEKIQKENYSHPVWSWVFHESGEETGDEHITVPRYRVIQLILELGGIFIVFYFCGLWPALGLVLSHYLMSYDMLFYLVLNPGFIGVLERTVYPYWLVNWYQAGFIILRPFSGINFIISGSSGLMIALLSCYLPQKARNF